MEPNLPLTLPRGVLICSPHHHMHSTFDHVNNLTGEHAAVLLDELVLRDYRPVEQVEINMEACLIHGSSLYGVD